MIDWNASAELNKVGVKELKAYFRRYSKSNKKVVIICGVCNELRTIRYADVHDAAICNACSRIRQAKKMGEGNIGSHPKKDPMSTAQKKKLSIACMGRPSPNKGRIPSLIQRRKHSAKLQGIPYDEWESFAKEQLYCPRFNEACRESCRAKYGYRCFICNKPQSKNITKTGKVRKLSVHHVDMDKAQGCKSNWKLVPLCMDCHATAHNDELIARLGYMVRKDS